MSDPMRPPSGPLSKQQLALAVAPDYYYKASEKHKRFIANGRTVPELKLRLDKMNLRPKASVMLVKNLHSKDHIRASTTDRIASCSAGPGIGRTRSNFAKAFVNAGFSQLPEVHPYAAYDTVADRIAETCRWENMGPEMTLGRLRKYFPKKGALPPLRPPTEEEALRALADCGLVMLPERTNKDFYKPYPLRPTFEGERSIRVSKKSYNGLPTEGTSDDEGAMAMAHQLAVFIREKAGKEYETGGMRGVDRWVRRTREKLPHLTTCVGRAKDDAYTNAKYDAMQVRFYNVFPRPLLMIMQQGTQPLFDAAQSCLDEDGLHSMCKVSLAHGGAEHVVQALQRQLDTEGFGFLVMGDDSWVVIRLVWKGETVTVMFALDCHSFDLTQRGVVRAPTLKAMADQLELFDGVSAGIWHSLMTERDVIMMQALVYTMVDSGPSGGPGQSEINSQLMCIYIRRIISALTIGSFGRGIRGEPDLPLMPSVRAAVEKAGQDLGFDVKLEQYIESSETEIKEILRERPFLFLGYHFHVAGDSVSPFCDFARFLSTTAFPSGMGPKDKREFNVLEVYRLGGALISMGVPPLELNNAYEAMRVEAAFRLKEVIMDGKEIDLAANPGAVQDCVLWPSVPLTLLGVYNAILRRPERLWLMPRTPPPLPAASPLMEVFEGFSWGDETDKQDTQVAGALLADRPDGAVPDPPAAKESAVGKEVDASRGVTPGNHGRPPPTGSRREGVSRPSPMVRLSARARAPAPSVAELAAQAFEEADSEEERGGASDDHDEFFDDSDDEAGRARGESMGSDEGYDALMSGVHHTKR